MTDVIEVLRGQLAEARDQVRRLETALSALEGSEVATSVRRRGRRRGTTKATAADGTSPSGKRRKFSAATIAKMRRAQKARWAKIKGK